MSGNRVQLRPIDARAARTRGRLSHALMTLGSTDSLDKIRVGDLVRTARVGRSTFYAHFESKDDFVCRAFADMISLCDRRNREAGVVDVLPVEPLVLHIAAAGPFALSVARSRTLAPMLAAGERRLRVIADGNLAARYPHAPPELRRHAAAFLAGALIGQIRTWLEGGLHGSAEAMIDAYRLLANATLSALQAADAE
jgi:AcrR family transcriptional regulator